MESPPEVRYVVRDGKTIAFQRFGSGDRRVVSFGNAVNPPPDSHTRSTLGPYACLRPHTGTLLVTGEM